MLSFNTNKPQSFLQNTSCIRKPQVISEGGVRTPCTLPLDPPLRSDRSICFSQRASTPIWESKASCARTRERAAEGLLSRGYFRFLLRASRACTFHQLLLFTINMLPVQVKTTFSTFVITPLVRYRSNFVTFLSFLLFCLI